MARRRAAEEAARKGEQSGQPAAKKKRKRKVRYPKGFDPANPGPPPNPERWLPKWQRSDFKKKRNRRKEKVCPQVVVRMRSGPFPRALLWLFWMLQAAELCLCTWHAEIIPASSCRCQRYLCFMTAAEIVQL